MSSPLRIGLLVALLSLALAAGACGSDSGSGSETSTTSGAGSTSTTETAPAEGEAPADGEPPAATIEVDELTGFASPTGNIGCYIEPAQVRCDIAEREWSPPRAPKSCTVDFGQGIELRAGAKAEFVCAGDTALNTESVLEYGDSIAAGLLRCESSEDGIICRDIETGRGFSLAREGYEIF